MPAGKEAEMRRRLIALALLPASVWAQDAGDEEEVPFEAPKSLEDIEMPEGERKDPDMPAGVIARGELDMPAVSVRVREAGVLQVKVGEDWKDATLADVSARLKDFAEQQERRRAETGRSAFMDAPGGVRVCRLFLSIEAEATVPCLHIQWLMTMAAEQKYYKLQLSDGTRKLLVSLPIERGIEPVLREPPPEWKVGVHAIARQEKAQRWGDVEVARPTEIRFRLGDQETCEISDVADYLRKAKEAAKGRDAIVTGEIKAGHKVPVSKIMDLMAAFEAAGIARVDYYGVAIPPTSQREAARLPYPAKNYSVSD
jgi:hypothetical protein